jgi:endonuclease III
MKVVPLTELINWEKGQKLKRIQDLSWFLFNDGIENEDQLAAWLNVNENIDRLGQINGIGPKTIDYLRMLSGNQAIAIDRHLFGFLKLAGIPNRTYEEANLIYSKASEMLGMSKYEMDRKVWLYMSKASV